MGFSCSYTDKFHKFRKEKHDQTSMETIRLLLRLEQLTSTDENVPKNANTKERRSKDPMIRSTSIVFCFFFVIDRI